VDKSTAVNKHSGFPVAPGKYSVELFKSVNSNLISLCSPVAFNVKPLNNTAIPAEKIPDLVSYQRKAADMQRLVFSANKALGVAKQKLDNIRASLSVYASDNELLKEAKVLQLDLEELDVKLNGNKSLASRNENQTPSLYERFDNLLWSSWSTTSEPTKTKVDVLNLLDKEMNSVIGRLNSLVTGRLASLEKKMDSSKMPWTPGRLPSVE
jgi:hypothetical protein